jgi:hypothetical protein
VIQFRLELSNARELQVQGAGALLDLARQRGELLARDTILRTAVFHSHGWRPLSGWQLAGLYHPASAAWNASILSAIVCAKPYSDGQFLSGKLLEMNADLPEHVTCPNCQSMNAVVAYRMAAGPIAQYCPDCDHSWESRPNQSQQRHPVTKFIVTYAPARL